MTDLVMMTDSNNGPRGIAPWAIAVHTTEGALTASSIGGFCQRNEVSYNTGWDGNGDSVRMVADENGPWAAFPTGNKNCLHVVACGFSAWSRAEWLSRPKLLAGIASDIARWSQKFNIPIRRINADDLRAHRGGVCAHADISQAWEGNHTDPGPAFPYDTVLALASGGTTPQEDDDMAGDIARDIRLQLTGSADLGRYPGWPQLGGKTLVDNEADLRTLSIYLLDQLGGPGTADAVLRGKPQEGFKGWPQLGGRTLVDFLATLAPKAGA